jgi:septal ring factor EnvC (AmiA/AmiB activator)
VVLIAFGSLLASAIICGFLLLVASKRTVRIEQEDEFYRELSRQLKLAPHETKDALKQLRRQFEEKSEILRETRKALFTLEGELFVLRKEFQEKEHQPDEVVTCLQNDIKCLLEENALLRKENALLEELVASKKSENLMTVFCDEDCMFPLGGGFPVSGTSSPLIGIEHGFSNPSIDHRLDGEGHPRS